MTTLRTIFLLLAATPGEPPSTTSPAEFRLQDHRGAWHSLDEVRSSRLVVIAFVGAECPLAQAYAPRLAELASRYQGRGVAFFGVDANDQDGPVAIGRFAAAHALTFPILKDLGHGLADRLGSRAGRRRSSCSIRPAPGPLRWPGRRPVLHRRPPPRRPPVASWSRRSTPCSTGRAPTTVSKSVASRLQDQPAREAERRRAGRGDLLARDVAPILQSRCVSLPPARARSPRSP